jgi:hypothetical protein
MSRSRPLPVLVLDADTKKPISGAEVRLSYVLAASLFAPGPGLATTAPDGVARLWAANGDGGVVVQAGAGGYLAEEKVVPLETLQALEPVGLFENVEQRPVTFVVELHNEEPRPTVELVLPTGFRGLVKADVVVQPDLPGQPGQRRFPFEVPSTGVVRVVGPDLFRHVGSPDFVARYPGGPALGQEVQEGEVGFWCLQSKGQHYTFLVGSRSEFDLHRPRLMDETGERPIAGGKRGGRGRGGRHGGNQSSGDPGQP